MKVAKNNGVFYLENILEYLENERIYDYATFAKYSKTPSIKKIDDMIEFAKENLVGEEYERLIAKVYPFEPCKDGSDAAEKEELKKRILTLASDVAYKGANIIDIIDALDGKITGVLNLYMYMLKQLTYTYKVMSAGQYKTNADYAIYVSGYDNDKNVSNAQFPSLSEAQKREMYEILTSRGLPENDVTLNAAYNYYMRNKRTTSR